MSNINNNSNSSALPASSVSPASSLPSSSSAPAPASSPASVTLDVLTSLFQRVEATLAADRAAASTAAETAAAQIAALTNTVANLQAASIAAASSAASPSSSSAASCSSSPPSATRADAILGVDPTAINNLIASLSSASTQVPATHKASLLGVTATATDHTTTATTAGPTLSSPNPFILLNDELTAAAPGRPEHLIHALTTALTDGSKAAKRFKTKDEFSKALTTQYLSFVSSSSPPALLSAWYRYTVFLLSLDFQQAQDYHFELSQRMKAGEHDLVRDTYMNNEVYFTCVVQSKRGVGGGRGGGSNSSKRSYKPHNKSQHCDMHGECGHSTADCKGIAAGSKKKA
jgi:hypothetical protein